VTDTLVALHAVDIDAVGLADFGRPAGYLERQVHRWRRQMQASRSRELAGEEELHRRLASAIPESSGATIVHGDYRMDNTLIADDRVTAVLDWEMATLGDPLSDVALMLV
jgi:aminoglycoside phosphotransferase (APT) family kinase protein